MATPLPTHLNTETKFYESHKRAWLQSHRDEFVVVKGNDLLGFFANFHEAYSAGAERYGTNANFLVKRLVPQEPVFEVF